MQTTAPPLTTDQRDRLARDRALTWVGCNAWRLAAADSVSARTGEVTLYAHRRPGALRDLIVWLAAERSTPPAGFAAGQRWWEATTPQGITVRLVETGHEVSS